MAKKVRAVRSREQSAEVKLRMSPEMKDDLTERAASVGLSVNAYLAEVLRLSALDAIKQGIPTDSRPVAARMVAALDDFNAAMDAADALDSEDVTTT
jgi:DNA-binding ferritin-like protein